MPPKPKKNRDEFEIPNKHRIKLEKKDRKEHLRHVLCISFRRTAVRITSKSHLSTPMTKSTFKRCKKCDMKS